MSKTKPSHVCFHLSCWTLGMVAFVQILIAGLAVSVRVEAAREVRVEERVVTRLINVAPEPTVAPDEPAPPVVALPPPPELPPIPTLPPARPLDAPPIADPVVERLVMEAREARVAEDMGSAIVKLEEARAKAPDEPNVHYELGLVYETMAAFDPTLAEKAGESYQKVFELGTTGAGALYPLAARKLRDGIARPADFRGKLALGRTRIFKDETFQNGERVVLTIPVSAAPGSEPEADDFFVQVDFFDKPNTGDPIPASPDSSTTVEWISGGIDWLGGEELLRVTYILPEPDPSRSHLFGRRKYYGQVVKLMFKNELIDSQAWPRHLATQTIGPEPAGLDPLFLDRELLPPDFDPNMPLLPPLVDEIPLPGLPPLPER
ncbi:tetratricopeptide repeat protein [Haloferula rosea]|uniref:Tetratricopeptide repeat protein n=1 Tax=Haloferula rosea TaxID=490093 RepID=A0A934VG66_9BACT|nr:hypothetical protein [Haloferula rosea]MBK1827761.1 hypothetical protein [Haloferula rosea]